MDYVNPDALVSTEWLANHLESPDVRIVDCTWFMPGSGRQAAREFEEKHIPGAVRFDVDAIAEPGTDLPHMLPSQELFSSRVRKLGLGSGNRIICYDANGGHMAAMRVWWMFRVFGHDDVAVLNGGLPKWELEGRPVSDLPAPQRERHFQAIERHSLVRDLDQMKANVVSAKEQVVDARSSGRFIGTDPEPREGLKSGHIPGSLNLPFDRLLDLPGLGTVRPASELKAAFADAGIDPARPVVTTCGSGITAAVIAFGLYLTGHREVAVYDGSWTEWASQDDTPVEAA
ncbi:MAG: 3-mercaptopyruvate sulfurtransferase [Magnetovibrionaceae bacterium]